MRGGGAGSTHLGSGMNASSLSHHEKSIASRLVCVAWLAVIRTAEADVSAVQIFGGDDRCITDLAKKVSRTSSMLAELVSTASKAINSSVR